MFRMIGPTASLMIHLALWKGEATKVPQTAERNISAIAWDLDPDPEIPRSAQGDIDGGGYAAIDLR